MDWPTEHKLANPSCCGGSKTPAVRAQRGLGEDDRGRAWGWWPPWEISVAYRHQRGNEHPRLSQILASLRARLYIPQAFEGVVRD